MNAAPSCANHEGEVGNGFYRRTVNIGSVPAGVRVPRTRSGEFRPAVLPAS